MVWPIFKLVAQILGPVVGKSVVAAWRQVSTEAGNKGIFQREVSKVWKRQVEARLGRKFLKSKIKTEGPHPDFAGREGDFGGNFASSEAARKAFQEQRKQGPIVDTSAMSKKAAMPPAEAVKVLHLSEASKEEIDKRFEVLMAANGEKGASQYLHDKITHARDVAIENFNRGTLKKHIKIKKEDASPKPTDVEH